MLRKLASFHTGGFKHDLFYLMALLGDGLEVVPRGTRSLNFSSILGDGPGVVSAGAGTLDSFLIGIVYELYQKVSGHRILFLILGHGLGVVTGRARSSCVCLQLSNVSTVSMGMKCAFHENTRRNESFLIQRMFSSREVSVDI
jgi:hypothetical protein